MILGPKRFLDEGSAGGSGGAAAKPDPAGSATPKGGDGAAGGGLPSPDPGKANAVQKPDATPEKKPPDKAPSVEELQAAHQKALQENEHLKKKLGKQGNDLAALKALQEALQSPEGFEAMAKKLGHKIRLGGDKDDLEITDGAGNLTVDGIQKLFAARDEKLMSSFKQMFMGPLQVIQQNELKARHEDWDEYAQDRQSLRVQQLAGHVTTEEVLHYAVKGMNIAETVEAAKKLGRDEYIAELAMKTGGIHGGTGGGGGGSRKEKAPDIASMEDENTAKRVLERLTLAKGG